MSEPPASPLRFLGVTGDQLGGEFGVGDVVTIEYLGTTYKARIIAAKNDYDDWGTAIPRYDLEAIP